MIVDANVLVHAYNTGSTVHRQASAWLQEALVGDTRVGLPWQSLTAFVRVTTNPRIYSAPLSPDAAWRQVEEWLAAPRAWIAQPTEGYAAVLGALLRRHEVRGPLVSDAQLAALAIDHGVAVVSTDGDFGRFDEVRWVHPFR